MGPKGSVSPQKQPPKQQEPSTPRQTRSATVRNSYQGAPQSSSQPLAVQQGQVQPRPVAQVGSQVTASLQLGPNSSVICDGDTYANIRDFVQVFFSTSHSDSTIHEALQNLDQTLHLQQSILDQFAVAFVQATEHNDRANYFRKLQPQVFKTLDTMAKRERPAQERTDRLVPRLRELMGNEWYNWYFGPYETSSFADKVGSRFRTMDEEKKTFTEIQTLIHSAWAHRLLNPGSGKLRTQHLLPLTWNIPL